MTSWAEEVLAMARKLPREDRMRIAEELQNDAGEDEGDGGTSATIEAAWNDEIADRLQAVDRGDVELVDAKTVFERMRAKHAR